MAKAIGPEVITVDFKAEDVSKTIHEAVPEGLDVCIDATTFHEPKTMLHKVEKALMLETDVCETPNEVSAVIPLAHRHQTALYPAIVQPYSCPADNVDDLPRQEDGSSRTHWCK
jgi:hypothetical protein